MIGLNVITMAMEFYMMPPVRRTSITSQITQYLFQELNQALKLFNYFFTATFCLEALLKVVALGPERYFSEKWNQLDMAIVALSVLGITLEEIEVLQDIFIKPLPLFSGSCVPCQPNNNSCDESSEVDSGETQFQTSRPPSESSSKE